VGKKSQAIVSFFQEIMQVKILSTVFASPVEVAERRADNGTMLL
jgi:hypothetical protein